MSEPSRKPIVTVSVFLFGKPALEIERLEGSPVDLDLLNEIASCGQLLSKRLARVAELGKRLIDSGWEGVGLLWDIDFYKEATLKDVEEELKALGIARMRSPSGRRLGTPMESLTAPDSRRRGLEPVF